MELLDVLDAKSPAGQRVKTKLTVPLGTGGALDLPALVLQGERPGPTLLVAGAVHGDEFDGPEAIRRLWRQTSERELSGAVIALPVLNLPAYLAANRVNPDDPRDMSGAWPGSATGSVTERIAWAVSQNVIPRVDAVLDLHSGGSIFKIYPLAMYDVCDEPVMGDRVLTLAKCTGVKHLWRFAKPSGLSGCAARAGKPAVGTELGGEARLSEAAVRRNLDVARNIMRGLGMIAGSPALPERWFVVEGRPEHSRGAGFLVPHVSLGERVEAGQHIGTMVDCWGDEVERAVAPHAGIVTTVRTMPVLGPGGATFQVSRVVDEIVAAHPLDLGSIVGQQV